MKKELYSILKESKASDFIIKEITTYSQEAFFIGQKLDMSRAKEVTHTMVTVYVDSDDKKYRGSATKEIHPTYSVEEIKKEIDKAIFAARFVQNPWFPLVADQQSEGNDLDVNLTEELVKICEAMQKVKAKENEKVNSYEVFVNKKKTHILNSQGVDVTFYGFDCEVEAVINTSKEGHEIELYKDLRFANKKGEEITLEIEKMFISGEARLKAVSTKKNEHANVILSGDDVVQFFQYFTSHTNAANQYMGIAKAKIDEKMSGDDADDLTIELKAHMDGSTKNDAYDMDGNPVKDRILFDKGVCKTFWGSIQHAHYIHMDDTTSINNVVVHGGSMSIEDMKKDPYLEVTDFSSFIMDPITGSFGGEIRLGYEKDARGVHPVAGGSISANFSKAVKNMKFSKETRQINNYIVPCAVYLRDVVVAGE